MPEKYMWLVYVGLAGLAWGTYVPIIFYGGGELSAKPGPSGRFMAILCVGGAYFVIGVLLPLLMFTMNWMGVKWADVNFGAAGVAFSSLAGVAGAVGAICVIFATQNAVQAARTAVPPLPDSSFRIFIAPLIFGLAPVINTLVSIVWHPDKEHGPWHFALEVPGWKLWAGILLVGAGAALVLYSKDETEEAQKMKKAAAAVAPPAAPPPPASA